MITKARVQKHRAKLKVEHCGRLEAWVSTDLIEALRTIARGKRPMGATVQDALAFYVEEYEKLNPEGLRLQAERARLLEQDDSPHRRPQIQEHNRQIATFNARVSRLQHPGVPLS